MHQQAQFALDHPVFDPVRDWRDRYNWRPERLISAGLSCNIGME